MFPKKTTSCLISMWKRIKYPFNSLRYYIIYNVIVISYDVSYPVNISKEVQIKHFNELKIKNAIKTLRLYMLKTIKVILTKAPSMSQ